MSDSQKKVKEEIFIERMRKRDREEDRGVETREWRKRDVVSQREGNRRSKQRGGEGRGRREKKK